MSTGRSWLCSPWTPEQGAGQKSASAADQACWVAARVFPSISCCVRKMLHQSLCSAIGMPHSTHTRTRVFVSGFFEKSFWKRVMCPETEDLAPRFAEKTPAPRPLPRRGALHGLSAQGQIPGEKLDHQRVRPLAGPLERPEEAAL